MNSLSRRTLMAGVAASGLAAPAVLRAQTIELVMVGNGGTLDDVHKRAGDILARRHPGLTVRVVAGLSAEAIAQIKAARGASPYDFTNMEPPAVLNAVAQEVLQPYDRTKVPSFPTVEESLLPAAYGMGIPVNYNVIGIAYNKDTIKTPPTSWADLWKPEYAGKVGMARPQSNLGLACVAMAARIFGHPDEDTQFGLSKWKELKPLVGRSPVLLQQMLERGEIGVCPLWHSNTAVAASRGLPFGFVKPAPGPLVLPASAVMFAHTAVPDLVLEFIDIELQKENQEFAAQPPYYFGPTVRGVLPPASAAAYLPSTPEEIAAVQTVDWTKIAPLRGAIVEAFDRMFAG
jgi:ABC-type Fe3+ transport system substrate-binding protein